MQWKELKESYAPQFSPMTGAPALPARLAFGALFIKQRLGLTNEETSYKSEKMLTCIFPGFAGFSSKAL
jgi:hypothetical protein